MSSKSIILARLRKSPAWGRELQALACVSLSGMRAAITRLRDSGHTITTQAGDRGNSLYTLIHKEGFDAERR